MTNALTTQQKLKLHNLAQKQAANDHAYSWERFERSGYDDFRKQLGLSVLDAEAIVWDVSQNFYTYTLFALPSPNSKKRKSIPQELITYYRSKARKEPMHLNFHELIKQ
jgi:hypothetical protein